MRAEHRSRSFGSLANLEFEPAGELNPEHGGLEQKKDREILQMMDDVDLDDDRIVRSEVPPDFYPPTRRGQGGHHPPPQMMPIFPGSNGPVQGRRRR